jgi:hypothetical protein
MFGTVIGTMAVIIICVISSAGIAEFEEELNSLGLNGLLLTADNGNCEVELDDIEYINSLNFVDRTMPIVSGDAVISTERDSSEVYLWGVDNNADKIISLNVSRGRLIEMGDIRSASDVCIIDDNAFMFCDDIKKVTVSKNVTKIGYRAFLSCDSLEKILIPKTVLWIGADALSSCPNLTIYTERGAFAERFAQPYSIPVEYID